MTIGLLGLVTLVVFGRVLTYPILRWDDAMHILENPYLYPPMTLAKFMSLWRFPYFGLYIPMTYTMWGILKVWNVEPWIFHALNLSLHVANGALILSILVRVGMPMAAAVLGTAYFLLHPLVVEPVAWISGLKDVGAMFFGLLGVRVALAQRPRPFVRQGVAFLLYGLSIMTKPSGVVFPVLTGMLFFLADKSWVHSFSAKPHPPAAAQGKSRQGGWKIYVQSPRSHEGIWHSMIGSLMALPIIFVSMYLQPAVQIQEHVVWWKRPLVALDAVAFYASKLVVPWNLLPDYARMPSIVLSGGSWWSVAVGLLLILLPWILLRIWPVLAIGLGMVLVALLPNLGLIPFAFQDHSTVADRYAYMALLGYSLLIAWLARVTWRGVCLLVPLAAMVFMTYQQVGYWQDQVTLFNRVLEINPRSVVALDGLGVEDYRSGNIARAEDFFRRALAINPRTSRSWFNVGSVLWLKGDKIAATEALETSLKLDPNHPDTLNNLGFVYAATGKDQAAESLFRRALYVNRLDLDARYNLAQLLHKKGLSEESTRLLEEALAIYPGFAEKYFGKKPGL